MLLNVKAASPLYVDKIKALVRLFYFICTTQDATIYKQQCFISDFFLLTLPNCEVLLG